MKPTNQDKATVSIAQVVAIAEVIRELSEVPSGHLYARVSDKLDFSQYEQVIGILKRVGFIKETKGHLLRWTGPVILPETPNIKPNKHHG